jgi:hypothetical protein
VPAEWRALAGHSPGSASAEPAVWGSQASPGPTSRRQMSNPGPTLTAVLSAYHDLAQNPDKPDRPGRPRALLAVWRLTEAEVDQVVTAYENGPSSGACPPPGVFRSGRRRPSGLPADDRRRRRRRPHSGRHPAGDLPAIPSAGDSRPAHHCFGARRRGRAAGRGVRRRRRAAFPRTSEFVA